MHALKKLSAFVLIAFLSLPACSPRQPEERFPATSDFVSISSPVALSPDGSTIWVVNPDADSVTPVDTGTLRAGTPVPVGREPWAVAVTPAGMVVVMNRQGGSLSLIEDGHRSDIRVGAEPGGLALSADGATAFVTLSSAARVAVVDLAAGTIRATHEVGPQPWTIGVTGEDTLVTHRFARDAGAGREAWLSVLRDGRVSEVVLPAHDFGFPNVLEGLAIHGDDVHLVHLLDSPGLPNDFKSTVSSGLSSISLSQLNELPERRQDMNEPAFSIPVNFPRALAYSPDGNTLFIVLAGSNSVMGVDVTDPAAPRLLGYWPAGTNPRGIVLNADGSRAYVMNYLSRDVSVLDISDFRNRVELTRISVTGETLTEQLLRGKILFNTARDPRMTLVGWMSCASCHPDGGPDGTTWELGEGPRQTMPLWNLAGTAPFHAAATRDELQDFEHDIEELMGGIGLAAGPAHPLLGTPNGGTTDLDALAEFVLNGIRPPNAPEGDAGATARGREVFASSGCAACHAGPAWTTSRLPGPPGSMAGDGAAVVMDVLHDVGTFDPLADITGELGFDVPTLLALHATPPYLHSGAAADLHELLELHASEIRGREADDLVGFLRSIDGGTEPLVLP